MSGIELIVSSISLSLVAMTLSLAIAFTVFHEDIWAKWFIVFQGCLLGTSFLGFANTITSVFLKAHTAIVFDYIFGIMRYATLGFVAVVLPYFMHWIIGKKWGKVQRCIFFPLGILYFAAGLVGKITRAENITAWIQTVILLVVLIYTITELWINLKAVDNNHSKRICLAINIVTVCLIPTDIAIELFPAFREIGYSIYAMAFSIIMIVYFFIQFKVDRSRISNSLKLSDATIAKYKISDRELEVIECICNGKTNKEIAGMMNISVNTVNNHVANIFEKMNISSRVDLVRIVKDGPWA